MSKRRHSRPTARRRAPARKLFTGNSLYRRGLRYEPLEDRRLLAVVTVDTLSDTVDFNDGHTSLREAIFATNTVPGADTINFAPALTANGPATILLTQGELKIADALTITGPGSNLLTIDASGNDPTPTVDNGDGSRIFNIDDGNATSLLEVAVSGLTLTGGDLARVGTQGGAILSKENLSITDVTISDSTAVSGGGIYSSGGQLTVTQSRILGNRSGSGGGIFTTSLLSVVNSTISGNVTTGSTFMSGGGGIYCKNDTDIEDSIISSNSTTSSGGGILAKQALTIRGSSIDSNVSTVNGLVYGGGGIYCGGFSSSQTKPLTISDCTITNNKALTGEGGGIRKQYGSLIIESSTFTGNVAAYGAGISAADRIVATIDSSFITGNSTTPYYGIHGQQPPTFSGFGGGVFIVNGTLSIADCVITDNISGSGGGIYTRTSTVNVDQTSILRNSANDGGGIFSDFGPSQLNLTNSTIAQNKARRGAGIGIYKSSIQVTNSTISGNTASIAGGGIYNAAGQLAIQFSTISANQSPLNTGAGISSKYSSSSTTVNESIIAGNISSDVDLVGTSTTNTFQSLGFNVIGTGNAVSSFSQPGDQVGVTNPLLGPLADNGGFTLPDGSHILTQALLPGSPAINAGDISAVAGLNGVPQYDERGIHFTRVFSGQIDIGAFEYQQLSGLKLVVDTLVDESDGNYSHGDLSLREAIKLANMYPGPNASSVINTIRFDPALTAKGPATILLTLGELDITHGVNIIGPGANLLTIDASGSDRSPKAGDGVNIFDIGGPSQFNPIDVSISGLTLTGGDANVGGAINAGFTNLVLTGMTIAGNTAMSSGGGIYTFSSSLTVNQSTISGNVSTASYGGAIYFADSLASIHDRKLQILESQILNNKAFSSGGGVAVLSSTSAGSADEVDIEDSILSGNSTTGGGGSGGGLYVRTTGLPITVTIANSSLDHNSVGPRGSGGGAFLNNVVATIKSSRIESNSGGGGAGGISISGSRFGGQGQTPNSSIVDTIISGNTSSLQGAGIVLSTSQGTFSLTNDTIENNTALNGSVVSMGGGIFVVATNTTLNITGSTISGNSAGTGGGIYARLTGGQFTLDGSHVDGNTALAPQSSGAGVSLTGSNSTATIHDSFIENNSAPGEGARGGGIFSALTLSIAGSKISGNSSGRFGGGIYASTGLQIDTSEISGNSALLTKGIGGGVFRTGTGFFTLTNSTVSGNSATMDAGGLYFASSVSNIIDHSTISGNSAARDAGGIMAHTGTLGLTATTVSSNTAGRDGGGIWKTGLLSINGSTINNNTAGGNGGGIAEFGPSNINNTTIGQNTATISGGGIWANDGQNLQSSTILANRAGQAGGGVFLTAGTTAIYDSVVAADSGASGADVSGLLGVTLNVHFSLIGSNQGSGLTTAPVGSPDVNGNLIGGSTISSMIVPALGPLTMNGGPTATYAPLAGSVVINAGDPAAVAGVSGVPANDQRGAPFLRVYGGRIDMGAVETQPNPLPGDFNYNGVVDLADYSLYRKALTTLDPRADANGDGRINDADLAVWRANFGNTYSTATSSSVTVLPKSQVQTPLKMLPDSIAMAPILEPGTARIGLPIPVPDSASRPASTNSAVSTQELVLTPEQPLSLILGDRPAYRPSVVSSREHEFDVVDSLTGSSGNDAFSVDEVFATLGARKSSISTF